MTAIELLVFILRLCLSIGLAIGLWNAHPILGGIGGIGLFLAFPRLATILVGRLGDKPIGKPVCLNGSCQNDDYVWTRSEEGLPICKCKCGIEYVLDGNRFLKIDPAGQRQPYMVWSRKDGWTVDKGGTDK